jgi:hypothetical protein
MQRTVRLAMLGVLSLAGATAETLVMKHFTLIDGAGKPPLADAYIVVAEGRIAWDGPSARLRSPAGAQTDLHTHLAASVDLVQEAMFYTCETVEGQRQRHASFGVPATR